METKKNPKLDYQKKYALFFNIGLVLSLILVISAFEWKSVESISLIELPQPVIFEDPITPPITDITPQKPKVQVFKLIEIKEDEEIEEPEFEIEIITGEPDVPELPDDLFKEPDDEETDKIEDIVEKMPSYVGGLEEFYKFVSKNLKYPAQARRIGIEGKVFVHFVVDKDGSLSDIKVIKGIGAGCDEEVERIIHKSPKWNPGKQRGNPVRVRMMMPITFRLD